MDVIILSVLVTFPIRVHTKDHKSNECDLGSFEYVFNCMYFRIEHMTKEMLYTDFTIGYVLIKEFGP